MWQRLHVSQAMKGPEGRHFWESPPCEGRLGKGMSAQAHAVQQLRPTACLNLEPSWQWLNDGLGP